MKNFHNADYNYQKDSECHTASTCLKYSDNWTSNANFNKWSYLLQSILIVITLFFRWSKP